MRFAILFSVLFLSLLLLLKGGFKSPYCLFLFLFSLVAFSLNCHDNLHINAKYHMAYKNTSMQVVNKIHQKYPYAFVTKDTDFFDQGMTIYLLRSKPHSTQFKRPIILHFNFGLFSSADYNCKQPKYVSVHEVNNIYDSRKVLYLKDRNMDFLDELANGGN